MMLKFYGRKWLLLLFSFTDKWKHFLPRKISDGNLFIFYEQTATVTILKLEIDLIVENKIFHF